MTPGDAVELTVCCLAVMAPALWVSWVCWRAYGREDLLRRIDRRCDIHDRATPLQIRQLEAELGMGPSLSSADTVTAAYTNPALIDCGHDWCRDRRSRP